MRIGLRPLYDWAVAQSHKPHAPWLLFFIAFIEPCFVPIPPDALLVPMAITYREKAFRFAAIATLGSVIGGLVSYCIGALAMHTVGHFIIETYGWQDAFRRFEHLFDKYGMLIIIAKGLTPIPFMFVTLASGIAHYNLFLFLPAAALSRGGRFFIEAALIYKFGDPIRIFIEKYLVWVSLAVLALLIGGFWVVLHE